MSPLPATGSSPDDKAGSDGPYASVFDAIESDPVERERLKLLSKLSIELELHIRTKGWSQKQAAEHLGVTQPRISDLVRGRIDLFSVDALLALLWRAGVQVDINLRTAA